MSDTAIFIAATADELKSSNQLPGPLSALYALADESDRVVHLELLADAPLSDRLATGLHAHGCQVTVLPASGDAHAALVGGLLARLHEYLAAYPHVGKIVLAGVQVDRLVAAGAFLQRTGCAVILSGPDRARLDAVRFAADDVAVWGAGNPRGAANRNASRDAPPREREPARERDAAPREAPESEPRAALDPYEVLVDEVSKGRRHNRRVLLTSLKQRMRKRIRRFDETRMKDKDGRPMRKFKDFVVDAANRGLIQLIENGNSSHVLLPGEAADAADSQEPDAPTQLQTGDPLLDAVDLLGGENLSDEEDEDEDEEEENDDGDEEDFESAEEPRRDPPAVSEAVEDEDRPLTEDDFDVNELDEEVSPPPVAFMEMLAKILGDTPMTLPLLLKALEAQKASGEIRMGNAELRDLLQAGFNNELIEAADEEKPFRFQLADDWREIIDYL